MPSEYREERLVRVLQKELYERLEGVQEAVIVTEEGLVVAAYPGTVVEEGPAGEDAETQENLSGADDNDTHWIGALAAGIISQSRDAFNRLGRGAVDRILIGGESNSMIIFPIGNYAALAVIVDSKSKLGLSMFQVSQVVQDIDALLA
jgi:predicted regulator of Ras-like GTPase activity (Roadblock/LC7/MglB family)